MCLKIKSTGSVLNSYLISYFEITNKLINLLILIKIIKSVKLILKM